MKKTLTGLIPNRCLFWLTMLLVYTPVSGQNQPTKLLIRNVNIIDVKKGNLINKPKDLLIEDERIVDIKPAGKLNADSVQIFEAKGKYLIPGLWDMHTHPDDPEVWWMNPDKDERELLLPLFIVYGVTGTRDMAGELELMKSWKSRIGAGELIGPEIIAAGPLLDGADASWDGSVSIEDAGRIKAIVDSLAAAGVDFLKIYSGLPRDVFFALCKYAKEVNLPVVGHIPTNVTTVEGAEAGMICQEHLLGILMECSRQEENIRNDKIDYGTAESGIDRYYIRNRLMMDTYDEVKAKKLFRQYVKFQTWHTPTISMWYKNAYYEEEVLKDEAHFKYLPKYLRKYWQPDTNVHLKYRHPKIVTTKKRLVEFYLKLIEEMHRSGVRLLAGTDVGANPLCLPGIGVHNELSMFVKAGLSPAEALKTATINPPEFLMLDEDFGTVEIGKIANLVLLDGNPLDDIENIRQVSAVIKRGDLFDESRRNKILKNIERQLQ